MTDSSYVSDNIFQESSRHEKVAKGFVIHFEPFFQVNQVKYFVLMIFHKLIKIIIIIEYIPA